MKSLSKLVAALAVATVALGILPAQAATTSATILVPAPIAGVTSGLNNGTTNTDPNNVCTPDEANCQKGSFARAQRCAYLADQAAGTSLSQDATTGKLGFVIPVSASATSFTLSSVPANSADFDVAFYVDLGSCDGGANGQPIHRTLPNGLGTIDHAGAPTSYDNSTNVTQTSWSHFGNGAESGALPIGHDAAGVILHTRYAIVTVFGSTNATFSFTAS